MKTNGCAQEYSFTSLAEPHVYNKEQRTYNTIFANKPLEKKRV